MKLEIVKCQSIYADETRIQCNKEPGKKASTESFIWLYRPGVYEPVDIVIFEYTRMRSGKHTQRFLKGFKGNFITDTYAGYEKVENVTRCLCWSHVEGSLLKV